VISPESTNHSPPWGANVKLILGLTFVAIAAAFMIRFHNIIPPLLLTFVLTYLLHPLAARLNNATSLSWRMSVNLIFIVLVILLLAVSTLTGVALVQQFQSLINVVERFINQLPEMLLDLSTQVFILGPFQIDLSQYLSTANLESMAQELLGVVQPFLGQAGGLLGTLASGTVTILGWGFFVILVSYFILADMGQVPDRLVNIEIPGYGADIRRLARELGRIWNAFLRGQVILFTLTLLVYTIVLGILGIRYVLALALLAGFARFIPYVGPWVTWTVTILVAVFQRGNYFGLEPWAYAVLVVGIAIIVDQIFDNFISPRVLGQTLGVHPAAVLVAAIVAANLLGLVGVVLAAPVLATLILMGRYILRKMLDLDPWPQVEENLPLVEYPWAKWLRRIRALIKVVRQRNKKKAS
jgi:predicted PurR-regulated permease PerM